MSDFKEWKPDGSTWDEATDLWENQGQSLTVSALADALEGVDPSLEVTVERLGGDGERQRLVVAEIGYAGSGSRPDRVVVLLTDSST